MTTALMLRTCEPDMTSYDGFRWPESGEVEAPDWSPVAECGRGLHGLLWGEGDAQLLRSGPDVRWLVVEVDEDLVVDLGGKVKVPRGVVVACGTRDEAIAYAARRRPGTAARRRPGTAARRRPGTAARRRPRRRP
jgi:hypothetical protein